MSTDMPKEWSAGAFTPPPASIGAPQARAYGIDVSNHNRTIDWAAAAKAGVKFAFIKCSEGIAFADPLYLEHRARAQAAGIYTSSYHFFRPEFSPLLQALTFLRVGRFDAALDLQPALDIEVGGGQSPTIVAAGAKTFCNAVTDWLHVDTIIYCDRNYRDHVLSYGGFPLASYPLWQAAWLTGNQDLVIPGKAWTFWQFSDEGRVPGVAGDVDLDVFFTSPASLTKFTLAAHRASGGKGVK